MEVLKNNIAWLSIFIASLFLYRVVPHIHNFTPILASIVCAKYIKSNYVFIGTLIAMLVSDFVLGLHSTMLFTYTAFCVIYYMTNNKNNIFIEALFASVIFFILSNFGVWIGGYYPYTIEGLLTCYTMAIPFFQNTLLGTLFFTFLFFSLSKTRYLQFSY
tara:strand:+ start:1416 stop:1895 length:480 start_codon:yes stop_codon:yes gene_type:complete